MIITLLSLTVSMDTLQDYSLILPPAITYNRMSPSRAGALMDIP